MIHSFAVATTSYVPRTTLEQHYHEGATLSLIFRGGYTETLGRRHHECEPLAFVYKPPRIEHSNHIWSSGLDGLFAEVSAERFGELEAGVRRISDSVCVASARARMLVAQARREAYSRLAGHELALEGILLELWALSARASFRPTVPTPPWLARAREYLHAHFRESIGLSDVARAAGVHPVHLAQTFRRRYGLTVGEHVRELRVDFAARALAQPERSIGDIALSAGFADHSHFARTFKAVTGETPSAYRASLSQAP
jgi:AraC family transcriptional regulator